MGLGEQIARRAASLIAEMGVELNSRQLADLLSDEFPDAAYRTILDACKPGKMRDLIADNPRDYHVTVIASDFHVPFHHVVAVENWLTMCARLQPDRIVINGDFLDCIGISSFPVPPGIPSMQDEVDEGYTLLKRLRDMCPASMIDFLEGNHEQRLERLVMREPGLYGLKSMTIRAMLELDKLRISHHRYMAPVQIGELTCVHGNRVSKHAGFAAKATLLDGGFRNVVVGHTHRLGLYCHTGHDGQRRAAEIGGMFDADQADYIQGTPNWQNGFAICRQKGDWCDLQLVEVSPTGRFVVDGEVYQ